MSEYHQSVLLKEAVESLSLKPSDIVVDATLGGGGHAREILKRIPDGLLIGFDRDPEAISECMEALSGWPNKRLINSNFSQIKQKLAEIGVIPDKVLFDLGVSGHQLDSPRGFSFLRDEYPDMRMSGGSEGEKPCAWYINNLAEDELADIIYKYGEERLSRRIARAIVSARDQEPIESTLRLAEVIRKLAFVKEVHAPGLAKLAAGVPRAETPGALPRL